MTTPPSDRPLGTSALSSMGNTLPAPRPRDAVHIAVFSAYAGAQLIVGESVGLNDEGQLVPDTENPLGIVDPFLARNKPVPKGAVVWVLLNPGRVTDVRHVWNDPAVDSKIGYEPTTNAYNNAMRDRLRARLAGRRATKTNMEKADG